MERKLKVLDLFAGIGGFALGLDSTNFFKTVKFVEKDKYCQKVLRKNFPNIPIEEDIKDVKGKRYEADVIVGGFPCQPMSVAGKRKGTDDDRYLWPEMFRLIREIKPEFVIGENVQGLVNLQNGMVHRQVQDQLESEGFEVQCFLIPASGIGAWHQRYRVWIVGHSQHNGLLAAEKRCRDEKDYGGSQKGQNETIELERTSGSRDNEDVSNTDITGSFEKHSASVNREIKRDGSINESGSRRDKETKKDVSNTENRIGQSTEWQRRESIRGGSDDRIWSEGERENIETNVSNSNTRLSIGENEEVQTRRETIDSSSPRGGEENVSNTEVIGTREPKNINQEKRNESSSPTQSNSSSEDVSNTNSGLRRGWRTIEESGENKVWRFYSEEEEQTQLNIRSETIGRDAISREDVSDTNTERLEGHGIQSDNKQQQSKVTSTSGTETQRTWWQIESDLCGVPNGISYELDKNRANRIKTLGNAIVPQIAREIGLAIKKALADEDII